jgi:hypothetical protein
MVEDETNKSASHNIEGEECIQMHVSLHEIVPLHTLYTFDRCLCISMYGVHRTLYSPHKRQTRRRKEASLPFAFATENDAKTAVTVIR